MFAGIGRAGGAAPCRNFDLRPVGYVPLGALRAAAHHPSRARHLVRGPVLPACAPVLVCALLVPVPVCTFRKRAPPHYCLGRPSGRLLLYRTRHGDAIGDGPAGSPADHPGQPFRPRAPRPHPPASSPPFASCAPPNRPHARPHRPHARALPARPLPRTRLPIPIARAPARPPQSPTPTATRTPARPPSPPRTRTLTATRTPTPRPPPEKRRFHKSGARPAARGSTLSRLWALADRHHAALNGRIPGCATFEQHGHTTHKEEAPCHPRMTS